MAGLHHTAPILDPKSCVKAGNICHVYFIEMYQRLHCTVRMTASIFLLRYI